MNPTPASPAKPALTIAAVANVLSSPVRWKILAELAKGEPLPILELARRLGESHSNTSKHIAVLQDSHVIQRSGFGRDFRIADAYQVPGERAIDLGWALVRLDQVV